MWIYYHEYLSKMASSTKEQNWKQIHFDSGAGYPKLEPSGSMKKTVSRRLRQLPIW